MISENVNKYCIKDQISLIENYDLAINDEEQIWDLHHRRETEEHKSMEELIDEGLYFNRPAAELIFLPHGEHMKLHNKGENHPMSGKCRKREKSYWFGKKRDVETKRKISDSLKGNQKKKFKWLTPDGRIVEMNVAMVKRWHSDWTLIDE